MSFELELQTLAKARGRLDATGHALSDDDGVRAVGELIKAIADLVELLGDLTQAPAGRLEQECCKPEEAKR